jgi:hypothetical protein
MKTQNITLTLLDDKKGRHQSWSARIEIEYDQFTSPVVLEAWGWTRQEAKQALKEIMDTLAAKFASAFVVLESDEQ